MTKRYKGEEKAVKEENRTASQKTKGKISTRRRLYRHISYGFPDFGWESSVVPRVCLVTGAWYPRSAQLTYSSVPVHSFHKHLSLQTYFVIPDR